MLKIIFFFFFFFFWKEDDIDCTLVRKLWISTWRH
jgi:hypothetical protein